MLVRGEGDREREMVECTMLVRGKEGGGGG